MMARRLIRQCFCTAKDDTYIPIRPLSGPLTEIFARTHAYGIPTRIKALYYSPFLVTLLEGIIN